jgi:hypothetical protein
MAGLETTPDPIAETKTRFARKLLYMLAGLWLAATAVFITMRSGAHPLERRVLGAWDLRSTPSGASDERIVEFRADGRCSIYRKGRRASPLDTFDWRISNGDLVFVFDNPLSSPGASAGRRIQEALRRVVDPRNVAKSYRYSVKDDGDRTITITLAEERGSPPARKEWAVLTRARDQPVE